MNVVIIDDELNAIKSLSWELNAFCKEVDIINQFTNPIEALTFVNKNEIDIIFLDIEMPGINGFQFLDKCQNKNFKVVITTAYDQYAIQAIKHKAYDYLLKPIDSDDLKSCIEKIKEDLSFEKSNVTIEKLLSNLTSNNPSNNQKISFNADGRLFFYNVNDILYFKSEGNYSFIYTNKTTKKLVNHNLKSISDKIDPYTFARVHNSYIVNLSKIVEFNKAEQYIVLEDDVIIPVSRNKKDELLNKL